MKTCKKCNKQLPLELLVKNNKSRDGRANICKKCLRNQPKIIRKSRNCPVCREHKKMELFGKNAGSRDGYTYACNECLRKKESTPEAKLKTRLYSLRVRDRINERNTEFRKRNPDKVALYAKRDREKYPEKYKARYTVHNALRDGKLFKQPCEVCGSLKSEAHHDDYSKPLEVRWVGHKHHGKLTFKGPHIYA